MRAEQWGATRAEGLASLCKDQAFHSGWMRASGRVWGGSMSWLMFYKDHRGYRETGGEGIINNKREF